MKLLVISDTHHSIEHARKLILNQKPDYVLHLGDMCADCEALEKEFSKIILLAVKGNNDYSSAWPQYPDERVFTLGGKKIFMCHGHKYNVKFGLERLYLRAEELGADIALYGHTHFAYLDTSDGLVVMNPGSVETYGIIEISDGKICPRLERYEQK